MQARTHVFLALAAGFAAFAAPALAQQQTPSPCAASKVGCDPLPAAPTGGGGGAAPALPRGVVVIDGYKYALPEAAAQNLEPVRVLLTIADALGMIRDNSYGGATHVTVGEAINGWQYYAEGTVNGQKASAVVNIDYRGPSIRYELTKADKSTEIQVASGKLAWDESKTGVYSGPAKTTAEERLLQIYLLPAAVVTMGRQAADKIKIGTKNGQKEISVPIPAYSADLKATIDASGRPTHSEITVGGKLYSADFSNYDGDTMEYHVSFPHKIVQKVDGNVVADLTVSEHWVNPYLVWPIPAALKGQAAK